MRAAAGKAFRMQRRVDVARFGHRHLSVYRKCPLESLSRRSSAEEARSMSGGQARRFVQEEQFGVAPWRHYDAVPALKLQEASNPTPVGVLANDLALIIVQCTAAVTHESSTGGRGENQPGVAHTVL